MKIDNIFEGKEDVIYGKGATAEEIADAEKKLGVVFSDDYRQYLLKYRIAMYDGHELTGLGKEQRTNVVNVTNEKKMFYQNIPSGWYVVEDANIDGIVIWQDAKGNIYCNNNKINDSLIDYVCEQ